MTKTEARQILGISSSTNRSKAELLYQEKCKKIRLQMVPGMPVTTREKALAKLTSVNAAWETLQSPRYKKPTTKKSPRKKTSKSSPVNVIPYRKPKTLAEAWEQLISLMPFSRPVAVVIIIAVFLLTLVSLIASL